MRELLFACLLAGLPVSVLGFAGMTVLLTASELPQRFYAAAGALPLLAGCFCAGISAGRRRRRGGLKNGAFAALLLSLLWYAAACVMLRALRSPVLMLTAWPAGSLGGLFGVNTVLPLPGKRSHRRERLRVRCAMLFRHRPKKITKAQ
ncbi:MAG: TIGR04086 family membrane protein [Oscillospiraceae bacterium]|nr:TIGR04086 family membrane protein [Oscillospiraceae bacterium]